MERRQVLRLFSGAVVAGPTAAMALQAAPAAAATAPAAQVAPGSRTLDRLLDAEHAAGMTGTFACVRAHDHTDKLTAGCADIGTRQVPHATMQHRIGDITKTFTAATVVLMACEGRIDLDKPICDYLPGLVPGELGMMVTVRMLLNHTSCIADYTPAIFPSAESVMDVQRKAYTPSELVMCGLEMTGDVMPGEMYLYSSTNYVILGCLIEKIAGRPYEQEVERRILRPLHLNDTYFPGAETRIRGSHMKAYICVMDELCDVTDYNMSHAWASGSLVSTARDVQRFYAELLGGRLLPSMGLREMLTAVPIDAMNPQAGGYGLGVKCMPGARGAMWGHDGYAPGHAAFAWNSQDGRSTQMFQAENLTWYAGPYGDPASPIDKAREAFQAAACR